MTKIAPQIDPKSMKIQGSVADAFSERFGVRKGAPPGLRGGTFSDHFQRKIKGILGIAIEMGGIGNLKGGQQVSERGNFKGHSSEIIEIAKGITGIGNLRGGPQVSKRGNLNRNSKEIIGIAIGIGGIGNWRGGQHFTNS